MVGVENSSEQDAADRLIVALAVLHCQARQRERPTNERLAELQRAHPDVILSLVDLETPR